MITKTERQARVCHDMVSVTKLRSRRVKVVRAPESMG